MMTNLELLKEAQRLTGLNQRTFGTYIGVSFRTISNWMTETRSTPVYVAEMALRIAKYDTEAVEEGNPTSGMFRWSVISENGQGDEQILCCGSKADALREAEEYWNHLTEREKKAAQRFEVSLIHVCYQPTFEGSFAYYEDEHGRCDSDTYDTAKDWIHK